MLGEIRRCIDDLAHLGVDGLQVLLAHLGGQQAIANLLDRDPQTDLTQYIREQYARYEHPFFVMMADGRVITSGSKSFPEPLLRMARARLQGQPRGPRFEGPRPEGVATGSEELSNGLAGQHGGNLDDHFHGKGARIYFPVRQAGGMFAVGDMHASMGDGEICFTGVEIAGEVAIRFELLKGKQATWPVTELADRWVPHATADQYDDALKLVSEEAARLLVDEHGFSLEDAFMHFSGHPVAAEDEAGGG